MPITQRGAPGFIAIVGAAEPLGADGVQETLAGRVARG